MSDNSATIVKSANFGRRYAGLNTVGYTIIDEDGTELMSRTQDGVYEVGTNTGMYAALMTFEVEYAHILWDTGGAEPRYATEEYNRLENNPKVDVTRDDVIFMRAMDHGRWSIFIDTYQMVFYAEDNSTIIARYNLFDRGGAKSIESVFSRVRNDNNISCNNEADLLSKLANP